MPTPTYIPLATITLTATDSSIVFSSIPATYRDLVVVFNGAVSASGPQLRINADTGTNYTNVWGGANDAGTVNSGSNSTNVIQGAISGSDANKRTVQTWQVMDYSATDKHKSVLGRNSANDATQVYMTAGRWANTVAVTSLTVVNTGGNFNTGSTFSLYGVN